MVSARYRRAQKIRVLAWLDADLFVAGELMAFTALELALNDRYGHRLPAERKARNRDRRPARSFAALLDHMVTADGLTDAQLPIVIRYGGAAIDRLRLGRADGPPAARPTLSQIRNELAHGTPFGAVLHSGLLELIRDLIDYAYRQPFDHAPLTHQAGRDGGSEGVAGTARPPSQDR